MKDEDLLERILPEEIDNEPPARHAVLAALNAAKGSRSLTAKEAMNVSRMAVVFSKKWPNGSTLNCRFLDGTSLMKKRVEAIAHEWENFANIKLKFVKQGPAEIRISFFADSRSWSAVGRDSLRADFFPLHQPTMNYGWLRDDTDDEECARVVLTRVRSRAGLHPRTSVPDLFTGLG